MIAILIVRRGASAGACAFRAFLGQASLGWFGNSGDFRSLWPFSVGCRVSNVRGDALRIRKKGSKTSCALARVSHLPGPSFQTLIVYGVCAGSPTGVCYEQYHREDSN